MSRLYLFGASCRLLSTSFMFHYASPPPESWSHTGSANSSSPMFSRYTTLRDESDSESLHSRDPPNPILGSPCCTAHQDFDDDLLVAEETRRFYQYVSQSGTPSLYQPLSSRFLLPPTSVAHYEQPDSPYPPDDDALGINYSGASPTLMSPRVHVDCDVPSLTLTNAGDFSVDPITTCRKRRRTESFSDTDRKRRRTSDTDLTTSYIHDYVSPTRSPYFFSSSMSSSPANNMLKSSFVQDLPSATKYPYASLPLLTSTNQPHPHHGSAFDGSTTPLPAHNSFHASREQSLSSDFDNLLSLQYPDIELQSESEPRRRSTPFYTSTPAHSISLDSVASYRADSPDGSEPSISCREPSASCLPLDLDEDVHIADKSFVAPSYAVCTPEAQTSISRFLELGTDTRSCSPSEYSFRSSSSAEYFPSPIKAPIRKKEKKFRGSTTLRSMEQDADSNFRTFSSSPSSSVDLAPKKPLPAPVIDVNVQKSSRGRRVPISTADGDVVAVKGGVKKLSGARPYLCVAPECGKTFTRGEHLKRHVRSLHTWARRECYCFLSMPGLKLITV